MAIQLAGGVSISGVTILGDPTSVLWTPANQSSVELWLDAADASTFVFDENNLVEQWNNKATNGLDAIQTDANSRPVRTNNTLNSLPVVSFDGSALLTVEGGTSAWNFLHNGEVNSIYAVWQPDIAVHQAPALLGTNAGSSQNTGFSIYHQQYDSNINSIQYFVTRVLGRVVINDTPNNTVPAGSPLMISSVSEAALALSVNDRSAVSLNGNTPYKNNIEGASYTTDNATYALEIGAIGNSSFLLNGYIAEIVITKDISDSSVEKMQGYLAWKWGLQNELPVNHPYKNAPPTI